METTIKFRIRDFMLNKKTPKKVSKKLKSFAPIEYYILS